MSLAPDTVRHLEGAQLKIQWHEEGRDRQKNAGSAGVLMPVFPALKQDSKEFKSSRPAWATI